MDRRDNDNHDNDGVLLFYCFCTNSGEFFVKARIFIFQYLGYEFPVRKTYELKSKTYDP